MEFAADFTAIDFETASRRSDSACQLAAVRVRNGVITNQAMWFIRPEPFFFAQSNIRIHGITPSQIAQERTFGELWQEILETLGDDCLVAHNASFDIGVLLACLTKHGCRIPEMQYTCTRAIARRVWPNRPRFGLKPLADWLGIRFQHHDALADSMACAKIVLAAGIDRRADSLESLESKIRLSRGSAGSWGKQGPARVKSKRRVRSRPETMVREIAPAYQTQYVDVQRLLVRADFIRPLHGQSIVFYGKLTKLSQQDAELLASRSGGVCQRSVDHETSLLVLGDQEEFASGHIECDLADAGLGASRRQDTIGAAENLRQQGQVIRIISEVEFVELVAACPDN